MSIPRGSVTSLTQPAALYCCAVTRTVSEAAGGVPGRVQAAPPLVPTFTLLVRRLAAS